MLSPKRVKFRKRFKGRMTGLAHRGSEISFGTYGLQALEPGWITARQIEAARVALTRHIKRGGKVWIRVFPDKPITKKPAETRMGKGKGSPEMWVAVVKPGRVMFEITETVAMRNFAASSQLVSRLRALGCRVALDDFGAGMSSFGYLKNLELDMVKIDGSFVQGLEHDRMSQSIVRAVTEIGHQQGLAVVAEWVSTQPMLAILRDMGVDYAQGFALHAPERAVFQRGEG